MEWAQSRARAARWDEEVSLIVEEMRRVLHFLMWHEQWWVEQGERRSNVRSDIQDGLRAYAAKQASIRAGLAEKFADRWYPLLAGRGIVAEWPERLKGKRRGMELHEEVVEELEGDEGVDDDMFG